METIDYQIEVFMANRLEITLASRELTRFVVRNIHRAHNLNPIETLTILNAVTLSLLCTDEWRKANGVSGMSG